MVAQFTTETTNSEKAIYFLSLMPYSINKLKSQMLFTCRNFIFFNFEWKKSFLLREMVGDWRPPPPCVPLSLRPCIYIYIQNKFHLSQYCRLKSTLKLASHKNYVVFSFDLSADFVISLNDNLHILDFDVDADLAE